MKELGEVEACLEVGRFEHDQVLEGFHCPRRAPAHIHLGLALEPDGLGDRQLGLEIESRTDAVTGLERAEDIHGVGIGGQLGQELVVGLEALLVLPLPVERPSPFTTDVDVARVVRDERVVLLDRIVEAMVDHIGAREPEACPAVAGLAR